MTILASRVGEGKEKSLSGNQANRKWISGEQERKRGKRILNPPSTGVGNKTKKSNPANKWRGFRRFGFGFVQAGQDNLHCMMIIGCTEEKKVRIDTAGR